MSKHYEVQPGSQYPPGTKVDEQGVNFCVFSRHATHVELLLYKNGTAPEPFQIIPLAAEVNRTFFFWHAYVVGLPTGTHYTWRIDGPGETRYTGFRFTVA